MEKGLHLMSFKFKVDWLADQFIYTFKLSEAFKAQLLQLAQDEKRTEKQARYYAGRAIFKMANTIYQDQVLHFHGNLTVIEQNSNEWFYTQQVIDLEFLESYVLDWLKEEFKKRQLTFQPLPLSEWGAFEQVSLADLLDTQTHVNGIRVVEKAIMTRFENQTVSFIAGAPQLKFYRVLTEYQTQLMSEPFFPKEATPYSYMMSLIIRQIPDTDWWSLDFETNIHLWVAENSLNFTDVYFEQTQSTSAYLHQPHLYKKNQTIVFNQIPLRRTKEGMVYCKNLADQQFITQTNLDLIALLKTERTHFDSNQAQVLVTLPNSQRQRTQTVKGVELTTTGYGVGLPEKERVFNFIQDVLTQAGLTPDTPLTNLTKTGMSSPKKRDSVNRAETFATYQLEPFLVEERKLTIPTQPFVCPHKKHLTIGIFSPDSNLQQALIGMTRVHLRAINEIKPLTYQSEDGLTIQFKLFEDSIASEVRSTADRNKRKKELKKILNDSPIDGCFIEIAHLEGHKYDSKPFLRTTFAGLNIQTQFIHPTRNKTEKAKQKDILNRATACSKDLLAKLGCIEYNLAELLKETPLLIGVSKLILTSKLAIPAIFKVIDGQAMVKVFPYRQWVDLVNFNELLGRDFVSNLESQWSKDDLFQHEKHKDWLQGVLLELKDESDVKIYWDERVESILPKGSDEKLSDYFEQLFPYALTNGVLVRYSRSHQSPGYLMVTSKGLGKGKGIFASPYHKQLYYLIGERPKNTLPNEVCKWTSPGEFVITPSLNQAYFYSQKSDLNPLEEAGFTQNLRRMILTYDLESAMPYPLALIQQIDELVEAFFYEYGKTKKES